MQSETTPQKSQEKTAKILVIVLACMGVLVALLAVGGIMGYRYVYGDGKLDYARVGEAMTLSLEEYQKQNPLQRMRSVAAIRSLLGVWQDNLQWDFQTADKRMRSLGEIVVPEFREPGSAFINLCAVVGEDPTVYVPGRSDDPSLADALALSVNDLTRGMSLLVCLPGTRVIIDALHQQGDLGAGSDSAAYYPAKVVCDITAFVAGESAKLESSGFTYVLPFDAETKGGYFALLCRHLGLDSNTLYPKYQEIAAGEIQADVPEDTGEPAALSDEERIYQLLKEHSFEEFQETYVNQWYGDTTDDERVHAAQELLDLFIQLGEDTAGLTANTLASSINDSYDYGDRMLSVWQAGCGAADIDGTPYETLWDSVAGE